MQLPSSPTPESLRLSYDNLTAPIAVESNAWSGDHTAPQGGTTHMGRRGAGRARATWEATEWRGWLWPSSVAP